MAKINAKKTILVTNDTEYLIGSSAYDGLVDGSIVDFMMPSGKNYVKPNLCSGDLLLETIDLTGCTEVGAAAFMDCKKVKSIEVSNAEIEIINKNAFQSVGYDRANPSSNILTFDFRKSKFTSLYEGTFGTLSSVSKSIQYANFYFPKTLKTIDNGTLRYLSNCNLYFTGYAPQLLGSGVFTGYNTVKIYCFYKDLYTYKYGSNWSALSSITVGWCPAGVFEPGATLPTFDQSGHALTWYSDEACTTQITEANANAMYCTVSSTVSASDVTVTNKDAVVEITDGTNYYDSDNPIPHGTTVTINITPRDGYQPYILTKNGNTLVSGDTFTAASGETLNVVAIYYDGVNLPIDPTLGNNSWAVIKRVCDAGDALNYWNIGDTKTIEFQGLTYTLRLCDATANRYTKSGTSSGNKVVFEFTNTLANTAQMNSSGTNSGGFASSRMRNTTLPALYDALPSDLKEVISQVDVESASDGSATGTGSLSSSSNYLFLPSAYEIFGSRSNSNEIEQTSQYGWYASHNSASHRIKSPIGGSAARWWLRSPYAGLSDYFVYVDTYGYAYGSGANYSHGVAPCFCI